MAGCSFYPGKWGKSAMRECRKTYTFTAHDCPMVEKRMAEEREGARSIRSTAFQSMATTWLTGAQQRERRRDRKWDGRTFTYNCPEERAKPMSQRVSDFTGLFYFRMRCL